MRILIILAHQDDEFFLASRIGFELKRGSIIEIAYLTNGEGKGVPGSKRNSESCSALVSLGLSAKRLHFIGSASKIQDGNLLDALFFALKQLELEFQEMNFDQLFVPAWEGGHPDHDASHLVGLGFALRHSIGNVVEFSLYNGFQTRWKFFRVAQLIPIGGSEILKRKLRFKEALYNFSMMRFYKSQWRTWLALAPQAARCMLLGHWGAVRVVNDARCRQRPHDGLLLYERLFNVSYADFSKKARAFWSSVESSVAVESKT